MSTNLTTETTARTSPLFKARMAGVFWLMTIVLGGFAASSGDKLVVSRDAAATAANILTHESLFRWAVVTNLLATVCYLVATLLVYVLLKAVNRNLSLLAAFFSLTGCAVSGISFVLNLAPLAILGRTPSLSVFSGEQLQALTLIFLKLNAQAFNISMFFFALHVLTVGHLIFRSTFLPRILGVLLAITGACYLTNSFANFLSLPFQAYMFPFVAGGGLLGEGSLTAWLLIKGVNIQRWNEQSSLSQ
jgi:hypothetical protein